MHSIFKVLINAQQIFKIISVFSDFLNLIAEVHNCISLLLVNFKCLFFIYIWKERERGRKNGDCVTVTCLRIEDTMWHQIPGARISGDCDSLGVYTKYWTWMFWEIGGAQATMITTPVLWWKLYILMVISILNLHFVYQWESWKMKFQFVVILYLHI